MASMRAVNAATGQVLSIPYDAVGPPSRKLWHFAGIATVFVDDGKGRRNVYDKKSQR